MSTTEFKIVKKSFYLKERSSSSSSKILQIHHTIHLHDSEVKRLIFVSVVFDSECKKFACSDHQGNVFVFDLESLKYWRLQETSDCVLAFSPCKRSYLLLSKANSPFEILIVNAGSSIQKFSACGHRYKARKASFSVKGDLLITANKVEALVWETRRYTLSYELKIENLNLRNITFTPFDHVFANFVNNSVQLWNKTFRPVDGNILERLVDIHHFSFSKDGRCVAVASGLPTTICLYNGTNWQCVRKISNIDKLMCEDKQTSFYKQLKHRGNNVPNVKDMFFLDDESEKSCRILAIHSQDLDVYLLDLERLHVIKLFTDCESKKFRKIVISPNGKYIACICETGEIDINDVSTLLRCLKDRKLSRKSLALLDNKKNTPNYKQRQIEDIDNVNSSKETEGQVASRSKLLSILKQFGVYSEKHRLKIWKQLLQVPLNHEAYCKLLAHPADTKYKCLENFLRINNTSLLMHIKRNLILIASVCPVLENVDYLPIQVFPLIKLLHSDPLFCFEAIVTILMNYCQMWYYYDSCPPTDVLFIIESILEEHDMKLYRHYQKIGVSSYLYAFHLMKTFFSETLRSEDWLQLWDHILSNEPSFFIMAVVSYNIANRDTLFSFSDMKQLQIFFENKCRLIDMKSFIAKCYELLETTRSEIHPRSYLKNFINLPRAKCYSIINLVDFSMELS